MGRKDKRFVKDLHRQAYERMQSMCAFGESRAEGKRDGTARNKIYSFATYETYWRHLKYYLKWLKQTHPECTTLKKARIYCNEWLQTRVDAGMSAWTVHTEQAALTKLFDIKPDDVDRFQAPLRRRQDIKRSRNDVERDKHFSVSNNLELVKFCKGTGVRRNVLKRLRGDDLWSSPRMERKVAELKEKKELSSSERKQMMELEEALELFPDQQFYVAHRRDKGGKNRYAVIIGPDTEMIDRMLQTPPDGLVWQYVHDAADIHGYRSDYASSLYRKLARPIESIPYDKVNSGSGRRYQSEVYICRNDERKRKFDKRAMRLVSKALGHNRISVIAKSYLRCI